MRPKAALAHSEHETHIDYGTGGSCLCCFADIRPPKTRGNGSKMGGDDSDMTAAWNVGARRKL